MEMKLCCSSVQERLRELEEFAERGVPDIKSCVVPAHAETPDEQVLY